MKLLSSLAIAALFLAGGVSAQDSADAERISRLMEQFSSDGVLNDDRSKAPLTRHEVSGWARQMEALLAHDANGDGGLSDAELVHAGMDDLMSVVDINRDGALDWDELSAVARRKASAPEDGCAPTCANLISLWMSI